MNIYHTQRITVTIPHHLHKLLTTAAPKRGISQITTKALEEYFSKKLYTQPKTNPAAAFLTLRDKLPRQTSSQTKRAITKGRTE